MGPRGAGRGRGRLGAPPPDLLSIGVVSTPAPAADEAESSLHVPAAPAKGRKPAAKKKAAAKQAPAAAVGEDAAPRAAKKSRAAKPRAKKTAANSAA
jgi:hypothetical protein